MLPAQCVAAGRWSRQLMLCLLWVGALAAVHVRCLAADERPNVLFIISDDLSAEALGCYGNTQCVTPNIDRLAQRGVQFQRAYCQFPVCGPSRACIMSGMYPQACGVTGNGSANRFTQVMGNRPSLPQHFRNSGYYTARVSKIYHMRVPGDITAGVDGPDHLASWSERFNCQAPEWMSEGPYEHLTNERLNRDPDKHYGLGFGSAFYVVKVPGEATEQADIQAANKAIEILSQPRSQPFFLAVGLVRPHVPLVAPASYFEPYPAETMRLPPKKPGDWDDIPKAGISRNSQGTGLAGQLDKQQRVLAAYYASVSFMDAQVGRILAALEQFGLAKQTIVVFTSDHGYHLGEHDLWQKMSLHEESTRIPLIIAAPGVEPAKRDLLVEQIDIYPTLADWVGLEVPRHVQGKSLVPALADPTHHVRDAVYCMKGNDHLLRTQRYALLRYRDGSMELYDMRDDPQQFTNLVDQEPLQRTQQSLADQLEQKLLQIQATAPQPNAARKRAAKKKQGKS